MKSTRRVLIADDEAHIRIYLSKILQGIGVETCLQARNGREALEVFKKEKPDIVFMDINMPYLSGLDALNEIMAIDEDAVIVMMTSVTTRESVEESAESGAFHYLLKDTPKRELTQMIKNLLEGLEEELKGEND